MTARGKKREAMIVGPVMPVWDNGRFAQVLIDWLEAQGYRVTALDSMVFSAAPSLDRAVMHLRRDIETRAPQIDVLIGYAFGGSLVVRAAEDMPEDLRVVALSAPTVSSQLLCSSLGEMCMALDQGDLMQSLEIHEKYATKSPHPLNAFSHIPVSDYAGICMRMARSFRMLMSQTEHPEDRRTRPPILFLLGEDSQLVGREHLSVRSKDRLVTLPRAGMRILSDAPQQTLAAIGDYLDVG
jgi:pimeloyl-ACP methyl ester carboxylesterase